jgi:hypothetical protein
LLIAHHGCLYACLIDGVAYIVNDAQVAKNLQNLGVRFIITDEIEMLKNALK